ncbi:receptor-like protein 7 [Corylus avellana]|uniref:receptor-like protein 7 n=1 Tax=Corylus avellana TaxID=13451 RepID=UPI00286A78EE|nr:receptor-like protein 7 [Corylus avellana]
MRFLFLLSQLHLILTHSSPSIQPLCHDDESSALLQFKDSFIIREQLFCQQGFSCQNAVASWTVEGGKSSDCCTWDGVECDEDTGHVIGLDLSFSCLYGSINSNSSLFRLVYLQSLNLAYNHFNYSPIPPQVGALSRLTHLNLSFSHFSGQIPFEISQLSHLSSLKLSSPKLSSLDLSQVYPVLELKKPSLESLVRNLSSLKELDLSWVDISSNVPDILANLSSLTFLSLENCGLYGEFPIDIFKHSNLQYLKVGFNKGITGYLPSFTWSSPLEILELSSTSFSGEIPASIGSLGFLTELNLKICNFSGSIPSSLGNLSKLTSLDLSFNSLMGSIPSSLGNLSKLISLYLSSNSLVGNIPPSLGNLVQLSILSVPFNRLTGPIPFRLANCPQLIVVDLSYNLLSGEMHFGLMNNTQLDSLHPSHNQLTGTLTSELMNLTQLVALNLGANKFYDQISNSLFNLKNLQFLVLSENYLNDIVDFDKFVKLKELVTLDISALLSRVMRAFFFLLVILRK